MCVYIAGDNEGGMEVQWEQTNRERKPYRGGGKRERERKTDFLASLLDPVSSFSLITAVPGREINGHNWPLKSSCLLL